MNEYYVCFQITGIDMQPDTISEQLKLSPDGFIAPHAKTGMDNGKIIERTDSDLGIWRLRGTSKTDPIPVQIDQILTMLRPLKDRLLEFKSAGLTLRFFCGHFAADITGGIHIPSNLLFEMGSLGIEVDYSFYCTSLLSA